MSEPPFPAEKIPDPELLRQAREGADGPIGVLIELALPPRRVELTEADPHGGAPIPTRARADSPEYTAEVGRRVESTAAFLAGLLSRPPLWLGSSRVFVAAADSGAQLRALARFPWIKAIHPNKRLVVRGGAAGRPSGVITPTSARPV